MSFGPKKMKAFHVPTLLFFLLDRSSTCICGCILRFLQIFRLFIDSHLDRKIIHPNTQVLNTMILFQWQPYFQVTQFHPCSICNVICETHYGLMRCITDSSYKELMINRTKCYVLSSGTIKKVQKHTFNYFCLAVNFWTVKTSTKTVIFKDAEILI